MLVLLMCLCCAGHLQSSAFVLGNGATNGLSGTPLGSQARCGARQLAFVGGSALGIREGALGVGCRLKTRKVRGMETMGKLVVVVAVCKLLLYEYSLPRVVAVRTPAVRDTRRLSSLYPACIIVS